MNDTQIFVVVVISVLVALSATFVGLSFKYQNDATEEGPFSEDFDVISYSYDSVMQKIFLYGGISLFIITLIIFFIFLKNNKFVLPK